MKYYIITMKTSTDARPLAIEAEDLVVLTEKQVLEIAVQKGVITYDEWQDITDLTEVEEDDYNDLITFLGANTEKTPEDYIAEVKAASDAEWQARGYTLDPPTFSLMKGSKYIRVVVTTFGSRSVHCFLDKDGNIYKSASWSKPAKGIRGNINNENKPLLGRDYYR